MTPEEELAYERRIADVLAIRGGKKEARTAGLQTWLNSSVLVALVGVLGTGVAGTWIANTFQLNAKRNEIERAAAEKRATDQNAATLSVLSIVASQSSAVDDLLTITNSSYAEERYTGKDLERLRSWKQEIRAKHDEADSAWRRNKITAGYTLLYMFEGKPEVAKVWNALAAAADNLETCADAEYERVADRGTEQRPEEICVPQRTQLLASLEGFTNTLAAARRLSAQ